MRRAEKLSSQKTPRAIYAGFDPGRIKAIVIIRAKRYRLTEREIEVILALAAGETWKLTAHGLGISPRTVRFHVENLRRKMGVANSVAAIARIFATVK